MDVNFTPAWQLDRLRVLAVSASPAALKPGDAATVSALVVDEPLGRPHTFFWLGCLPDPHNLNRSPCADRNLLENPAGLMDAQGNTLDNIQLLGIGSQAFTHYSVSAELFSVFPENHPQRKVGTVGMVLFMVVAEALPPNPTLQDIVSLVQRAQDKLVDSQTVLFRIPVRESDEPPNNNPIVSHLVVEEVAQHKSALVFLEQSKKYKLDLAVPPESFEEYTEVTHVGTTSKTEALQASFFATCGKMENARFNFAASTRTQLSTPNGKDIKPCQPPIQKLCAVVRDSRSGQTWHEQSFVVCQKNGPSPHIRRAELSSPYTLTLEGENLETLAELRLGGQFLWPLPEPHNGRMVVGLPEALVPGSYALEYTDFSCRAQMHGEEFSL
jgi:hypothetical protein